MKKNRLVEKKQWLCLGVFFAASWFLTLGPSSLELKILILIFGFGIPLFLLMAGPVVPRQTEETIKIEIFGSVEPWILFFLIFVAFALRFWRLTTLFAWPTGDDASVGILILDMVRHWNWDFFHGAGQIPPLIYWLGGLIYPPTQSIFLSLWLPSAVFSMALVLVVHFGARQFFSKSFALIFSALIAVSYWPLFSARLFAGPAGLVLWECVVFYLLARFVEVAPGNKGRCWASLLGLATGLGFFIHTNWFVIAGITAVTVIWQAVRQKRAGELFYFIFFSILTAFPFLVAIRHEGFGKHIWASGIWNNAAGFREKISVFIDYWVVLFGSVGYRADYEPVLGGVLNPVLTALFFGGVVEICRGFRKSFVVWFFLAFVLLMAEGFLSMDVEVNRIFPVLPFLFFAVACGSWSLLLGISSVWRVHLILFLLVIVGGFDVFRLLEPYWNVSRQPYQLTEVQKSPEKYQAFQILNKVQQQWGPGLVFTDWCPDCRDESLAVATYSFNSAWNSGLSFRDARWAAIYSRADYLPWLVRRFSDARWSYLPSEVPGRHSGYVLVIVPVDSKTRDVLFSWRETYNFFMDLNVRRIDDKNGKTDYVLIKEMADHYPAIPRDAFLQSCFLDKFFFDYMVEKTFHPEDARNRYSDYASMVRACLKQSYPNSNTYEKVGRVLMLEGFYDEADKILKKALTLGSEREAILADLKMLQTLRGSK